MNKRDLVRPTLAGDALARLLADSEKPLSVEVGGFVVLLNPQEQTALRQVLADLLARKDTTELAR